MSDQVASNGASGRLTGAEAAELSRQIAGLTSAGLPLAQGLVALGEELPRGRLRRSMNELAETLESGVPLDQAVEDQQGRIPPHLRGLVIAGVRSGRLGDLLSRFSEYVSVGTELKRRLWLSLAYPILTVSSRIALFSSSACSSSASSSAIYRDFNIPLPTITRALITFARVVNTAWLPVDDRGRRRLRRLAGGSPSPEAARAPQPGRPASACSDGLADDVARRVLSLAGLAPGEPPSVARGTPADGRRGSRRRHRRLMPPHGQPGRVGPVACRRRWPSGGCFRSGCRVSLRWAENQKSLPEVLHMAGSMFEARARARIRRSWEPFSTSCASVPVLSIVMIIPALFLPLITLIIRLSG